MKAICVPRMWKYKISNQITHNCINFSKKVKVKLSHYTPSVVQRVGRGLVIVFHACGTRSGWVVSSTPWPHFTSGKTRYPFYRRLGGPQGRSGRAENLVPTGFRSRTIQPIVSCYTDWANPPTYNFSMNKHLYWWLVWVIPQYSQTCCYYITWQINVILNEVTLTLRSTNCHYN